MKLSRDNVSRFALGKVFDNNTQRVNALDFSANGEFLVTSSDDESLHLYHIDSATLKKTVLSKRYGVSLVRFTHHSNSIVAASLNQYDESIRYLSLHDNKYLRYFKGHRNKVVSLEMSPVDDTFISGALDGTVRLWDLRTNICQGLIRIEGRPAVAFDPQGLIFGVAAAPNLVKLFDARTYDKGAFATFSLEEKAPRTLEFTGLKCSPDGKYMLVSTNENRILLLDAFDGKQKQSYTSFVNKSGSALEASFSPDSQFVLSGSEDGSVRVWDTVSGADVCTWAGHGAPVRCVQFNPTKMMVASACSKLGFWIPSPEAKTASSSSSSSSSLSSNNGTSGAPVSILSRRMSSFGGTAATNDTSLSSLAAVDYSS